MTGRRRHACMTERRSARRPCAERVGGGRVIALGLVQCCLKRLQVALARVERGELGTQVLGETAEIVGSDPVLARQGTDGEEPFLGLFEFVGVERQRLEAAGHARGGLVEFDKRPADRRQGRVELALGAVGLVLALGLMLTRGGRL